MVTASCPASVRPAVATYSGGPSGTVVTSGSIRSRSVCSCMGGWYAQEISNDRSRRSTDRVGTTPPMGGNPSGGMDRDLVEAAQRGDQEAFIDLVKLHGDRCFAIAHRILRDVDRAE